MKGMLILGSTLLSRDAGSFIMGPPGKRKKWSSAGKAVDGNPSQDDVGLIIKGEKEASTLAAITAVRMANASPAHALPKGS